MIMLLYYIHDLVLLKQIQRRMHFCTLCAVSMMQNVSQNRTDKKITKEDLDRIFKASYMTVFSNPHDVCSKWSGKGWSGSDITYFAPLVILVEGTGDNQCKVNWYCWVDIMQTYATINKYAKVTSGGFGSSTAFSLCYKNVGSIGQSRSASDFYPDLKIQKGEIKIIVETNIQYDRGKSIKELLGFYLISPSKYPGCTSRQNPYFLNYVIFSPRPGIFDPTTPPQ
ncbi:MAG: hypothetical protein E7015_03940 [Alphaproteobacteria bacterium]|nr:hypothetical protein [Alphaproteobacteria bacterium]